MGDLELAARLTALTLEVEDGGGWKTYAAIGGHPRPLYGMWQSRPGDRNEGNRRLLLWVRTPYEWLRPLGETSIAQLELADGFDPCVLAPPADVVDFEDAPSERLPAGVAHAHRGIVWTPGDYGAAVLAVSVATQGRIVAVPPPRPYYRCLLLPDQFGPTLAPAVGGAAPPCTTPGRPTAALRMEFSGDLAGAAVLALAVGRWSIEAFDAAGTSLGRAEAAGPPSTGQPFRASQLVLRTDNIRRLDLNCEHHTALLALGVQGAPSASESATRRTALEQALERFKGEEPVFEPNRRYRLTATTQVVEVAGRSLHGAEVEAPVGVTTTIAGSTCTVVQAFEFRTEGPPGFATLSPLGVDPDADAGLDTLKPYVREIVPPRGAPAFYRNYDLGVAFTADYVDQMYRWTAGRSECACAAIAARSLRSRTRWARATRSSSGARSGLGFRPWSARPASSASASPRSSAKAPSAAA